MVSAECLCATALEPSSAPRRRGRPAGTRDTKPRKTSQIACINCGNTFTAKTMAAKLCSKRCRSERYYLPTEVAHECVTCGKTFLSRQYKASCCSPGCLSAKRSALAKRIRAAGISGKPQRHATRADKNKFWGAVRRSRIGDAHRLESEAIFERDGWLCQICGEEVDRDLTWPHPRSVSLDHIVALARGGTHTEDNVQCAHLGCNSRKGAGPQA